MAWSQAQQRMATMAARAAGWNNQQRYMAMMHVGCPVVRKLNPGKDKNPSVRHPGNTQQQFELLMDLAEGAAGAEGQSVPPPSRATSWRKVAQRQHTRMLTLVRNVHQELSARIPDVFGPGSLDGFARRMTKNDKDCFSLGEAHILAECDSGQLYRVLEGLKAWGTRELKRRGWKPQTFIPNRTEIARFQKMEAVATA